MKMDNVRIFEGNEVEVFELKTRVLFRNGKKFIWKPINRATGNKSCVFWKNCHSDRIRNIRQSKNICR